MKYFVPIILGTAHQSNLSSQVVSFVQKEAINFGFKTQIINVADHVAKPQTDNKHPSPNFKQAILDAHAIIIVSPEYNHGYPGELKILLDQLYDEYETKPVLVVGVSDGPFGGVRMVENLLPVLVTLGMLPLRRGVYFTVGKDHPIETDEHRQNLSKSFQKLQNRLARLIPQ